MICIDPKPATDSIYSVSSDISFEVMFFPSAFASLEEATLTMKQTVLPLVSLGLASHVKEEVGN